LQVACNGCPKGTFIAYEGSRAEVTGGKAELVLARPLSVGQNPVNLSVERPRPYRSHTIALSVPLYYRITADDRALHAAEPKFQVRAEFMPGVDLVLDGKAVIAEPGKPGTTVLDVPLGALAEGPSDAVVVFEKEIAYRVKVPEGQVGEGKIPLRTRIAPARLDTPLRDAFLKGPTVRVGGQSIPGVQVTAFGKALDAPGGSFEAQTDPQAAEPGTWLVALRFDHKDTASRTIHLPVHLEGADKSGVGFRNDWLKSFEATAKPLAEVLPDPAKAAGAGLVFRGKVVDQKSLGKGFVLIVDATPCSAKSCLVRTMCSLNPELSRGDQVKVWSYVVRGFGADDKGVVPEVSAAWVTRAP
jgi:hypothetical protein